MKTEHKDNVIRKSVDFFSRTVWTKKESDYTSKKAATAVRLFKILAYTFKGMGEHRTAVRASALTFYTLMSLVPIIALVFAVVKGFGFDTDLLNSLYTRFPNATDVIDLIFKFVENLLARTKGGIIASVGFVTLVWAVMRVFGNIESAFNSIWEIRQQRTIGRKFADYMTVIFIAPIMWIISNSIANLVKKTISVYNSWALDALYTLLALAVIWLLFAVVYSVLPNTRVKFRNALIAGIVAGTAFTIFQEGYFYIQKYLTSYNAIYGTFAALPLLLIWLQSSWQIVLLGAELSFAYQNIDRYEQERESLLISHENRRKITLATMLIVVRNYLDNHGAMTSEEIAHRLELPVRIVKDVTFELAESGMLLLVKSPDDEKINMYSPARDVHTTRIWDIIVAVENNGRQMQCPADQVEMRQVEQICALMNNELDHSPNNKYLTDIIEQDK